MQAVLAPPDPPLADELIVLEPLDATHVTSMRALGDDDDVARFTPLPSPLDHETAREWVERYVVGWREGTLGGFAVRSADEGVFLGFIGIVRYDAPGRTAEVGYIVRSRGAWARRCCSRPRGCSRRGASTVSAWSASSCGSILRTSRQSVSPSGSPTPARVYFARCRSRTACARISRSIHGCQPTRDLCGFAARAR